MPCFTIKKWQKVGLATGQVTSAVLSIEDKVPDYFLPLVEFIVSVINMEDI